MKNTSCKTIAKILGIAMLVAGMISWIQRADDLGIVKTSVFGIEKIKKDSTNPVFFTPKNINQYLNAEQGEKANSERAILTVNKREIEF